MSSETSVGIPSYVNAPLGVFRDINHYRNVVAGIVMGLARGASRKSRHAASNSYLFDRLVVEFSSECKAEDILLDHFNSTVVLRAPKRKNESRKSLFERRMMYLGALIHEVEAMKAVGITQIYLAIKPAGRLKLDASIAK